MATQTIITTHQRGSTARSVPDRIAGVRSSRQAVLTIPKQLHQICVSGPETLSDNYRSWQQTWIKAHPQWQYTLWSHQEIEELIATHYSWFLPFYLAYPHWTQRFDVAKYFILHHFGGVYVDMAMRCVRPLDDLVAGGDLTFFTSSTYNQFGGENAFGHCVIGSTAGHHVWDQLFQALTENNKQKWYQGFEQYLQASTGVIRFNAALKAARDDQTIKVFSTDYFSTPSDESSALAEPKSSYAVSCSRRESRPVTQSEPAMAILFVLFIAFYLPQLFNTLM
eukprot:TRINITY_DN1389_c1_g1_i1.p1 TRINITY_DN1389_c1_g1~~TRINITY_DN1389_c1_g1_i1.p1  ORF type:complete len:280 (-),score=46.03 TRINITY_DN1389_c1_g1_i1:166-1005(-)